MVARYLPNGELDPTFGRGDGLKFTGGTHESGLAVALQPDGKIVVCGYEEVEATTMRPSGWSATP